MARAGDVIHLARSLHGVGQSELALMSGVGQSRISAYERYAVEPAFEVVERLVGNCGFRLRVELEDYRVPGLGRFDSYYLRVVQNAIAARPRTVEIVQVRAVVPLSPGRLHLLLLTMAPEVHWFSERYRYAEEYLRQAVAPHVHRLEITDLRSLSPSVRRELIRASMPMGFVAQPYLRKRTRKGVVPVDDRWYGTALVAPRN